jgi:hypothetical protein
VRDNLDRIAAKKSDWIKIWSVIFHRNASRNELSSEG